MESEKISNTAGSNNSSRMPEQSILFEKIVPIALILMGILTVTLILFAAGVILGIVKF